MKKLKAEIIEVLNEKQALCVQHIDTKNADVFFKNKDNKWSIAENLLHLAKTAKAVNKALDMPKEQLLTLFGKPTHEPVDYDTLEQRYRAELKKGGVAPPAYVPLTTEGDTVDSVVQLFDNQHFNLKNNIENFTEEELDGYQIPHPLLGNLTVREMLNFVALHIAHHTRTINSLLETLNKQAVTT